MLTVPGISAAEVTRLKIAITSARESVGAALVAVSSGVISLPETPVAGQPIADVRVFGARHDPEIGCDRLVERGLLIEGAAQVVQRNTGHLGQQSDPMLAQLLYGMLLLDTVTLPQRSELAGCHLRCFNLRANTGAGPTTTEIIVELDWSLRMILRTADMQEVTL